MRSGMKESAEESDLACFKSPIVVSAFTTVFCEPHYQK